MSSQVDDTPDLVHDNGSNEDEDLFGDDDVDNEDDVVPSTTRPARDLDDEHLDSGDDAGRDDRVAHTVEDHEGDEDSDQDKGRPLRILACEVPRINYPEGDESYMLKLPEFIGIKQEEFIPDTYEPPTLPHDGDATRQTSAMSTATSSMHWRHDPANPSALQSTARFVRWSDGSITLQLATNPLVQYPVNIMPMRQGFNKKLPPGTAYNTSMDSYTFLAAAHSTSVVDLQLVRSLDANMKIVASTTGGPDDADLRLREALQAQNDDNPLIRMKDMKEDPELARKAAEQFEKERVRAQKRRENAEERAASRRDNTLRRGGLGGRSGGPGLSVAGLEDDIGMPLSRGKKAANKRKMNKHGEIYSDDEDDTLPRGRTREDEYDLDDGFLADSEEDLAQYEDDDGILDDEEDFDGKDKDKERERARPAPAESKQRKGETPKRSRMQDIDDDDDAEGEPDDELLTQNQSQTQRPRKRGRLVVDEDEDEEED